MPKNSRFAAPADMAKLADAPDLGSGAARRVGSTPIIRTKGQSGCEFEYEHHFGLFFTCSTGAHTQTHTHTLKTRMNLGTKVYSSFDGCIIGKHIFSQIHYQIDPFIQIGYFFPIFIIYLVLFFKFKSVLCLILKI